MRIYLDICCFNRPFDDQSQLRIRLEAEAKLGIQERIRAGEDALVWSYVLDYENSRNPFPERRDRIERWRAYAAADVEESEEILALSAALAGHGFKPIDALHTACAITANADRFITTDDGILNKAPLIQALRILDPTAFVRETSR